MTAAMPISKLIFFSRSSCRKCGDVAIGNILGNEGIANRARQNECQLAALGLLVLPHDGNEIGNGWKRSLNIAHMGGKANGFQVFGNPVCRARFTMF